MNKFIKIAQVQISGFMKSSSQFVEKRFNIKFLFPLFMAFLLFVSGLYSFGIYASLPEGYKDVMIYIMSAASVVVIFIFSITTAQGQLYNFKDFDFLMSLPIPKSQVFLAKIISFVTLNLLYQALFILPALAIYAYYQHPGILFYIFGIVGLLFLTLLPLTFASILALLIRKLSGNGRYKVLLVNLGTFILMVAIFAFAFAVPNLEEGTLSVSTMNQIVMTIQHFLLPVYWYVNATVTGNFLYLIGTIGVCTLVFGAFIAIFSKTFIEINGQAQEGYKVKNFKLRASKTNGALGALLKKEYIKIFSTSIYFFNLAVGQMMMIVGAVYLVFNKADVTSFIQESGMLFFFGIDYIFALVCLVVVLFAMMTPTACVSISLEGKQWWITKTIPVKTEIIFLSKILVNATIIWIPSIISFVLIAYAFDFTLLHIALATILIISIGLFVGLLGVAINLQFPKLEFDREVHVIKQSMSSVISIVGGMIVGILLLVGFINLDYYISPLTYIVIVMAGFMIMDLGLWFYLKTMGVRKFNALV